MTDIGTQLHDYFDEIVEHVDLDDVFASSRHINIDLTETARRRIPGWVVAAAVTVVVLFLGGLAALVLGGGTDDSPVITQPDSTPTTVPEASPTTLPEASPTTGPESPATTVAPESVGVVSWSAVPFDGQAALWTTGYGAAYGGEGEGDYPEALVGNELVDNIFAVDSGFLFPASTTELLGSADGLAWNPVDLPVVSIRNIASAGRWVVLVGNDANGNAGVWRTNDGDSWERIVVPANAGSEVGTTLEVEEVALTETGDVAWVLKAPDGQSASVISLASHEDIRVIPSPPWDFHSFIDGSRIVDLGSRVVAHGRQAAVEVDGEMTYPIGWWELADDETWALHEGPFGVIDWQCGLGWVGPRDGTVFVNIECGGPWWQSHDGNTWETPSFPVGDNQFRVMSGDSFWLVVSTSHELGGTPDENGDFTELTVTQLWTSRDGTTWTKLGLSQVPAELDNGREFVWDEDRLRLANDIVRQYPEDGELVIGVAGDTIFITIVDALGPNPDAVAVMLTGRYQP